MFVGHFLLAARVPNVSSIPCCFPSRVGASRELRETQERVSGNPSPLMQPSGSRDAGKLEFFVRQSVDSVEKVRNRGARVLLEPDLFLDLVAGLVHFGFTSC